MDKYLDIANSPIIWLATFPVALAVVVQAVIFSRKAMKAADIVGLTKEEAKNAFKSGMIAAIGPAMGVFAVMLGLMSVIGAPMAWMRLSIIGSAPTEMAATEMAAKAQGIDITNAHYGLIHFANATWVMALNGSAWLLTSGAFSDKLEKISEKISNGDPKKVGILMVSAMCGAFAYLFNSVFVGVLTPERRPFVISAIFGGVFMLIFEKLGEKYPKMKAWDLGLAMFAAMAVAEIYKKIVMGG